jgi:hypothetical protein
MPLVIVAISQVRLNPKSFPGQPIRPPSFTSSMFLSGILPCLFKHFLVLLPALPLFARLHQPASYSFPHVRISFWYGNGESSTPLFG